ncbi:RING finger protein 145 [Collichthys lucidus]|uniref:RING finger protein 145 n=2 Tax=Percomorphaceae TaxID=1489872 RepID=A0A4U5V4R0_COLLU|nr:RING finger protein 145 [Collichthys lucidus]
MVGIRPEKHPETVVHIANIVLQILGNCGNLDVTSEDVTSEDQDGVIRLDSAVKQHTLGIQEHPRIVSMCFDLEIIMRKHPLFTSRLSGQFCLQIRVQAEAMAVKDRVEAVLNVGLRVPSIMLLDVLYRWDVSSFFQKIQRSSLSNNPLFQYKYLALYLHYVGYILSLVLLTLPRQHLVKLYLYVLTALLLFAGHQVSRDYVRSELESGYEGPVYLEPLSMNRFTTALIGQLVVCTLCSCVMQTKRIWLFSAHLLPLVARLCLVPLETIVFINKFSMIFTGLEVVEVYGLLALGMSLWNQLVLPVLFMCFWLLLFALQIYSYFSTRDQPTSRERLLFLFLTSIAECCSTPYSLLGLVFTVSFIALGVLTLCKFYLQGYRAFMNDNTMHRGMTEGITLLILAVQTGLIELQVIHRAFLLSIILFIVVASILQSMLEIADPIVLALGASRDKYDIQPCKQMECQVPVLCVLAADRLLSLSYMAYMICQFFHMDFWLLIIISSSILTSLQVLGTLLIYVLFMVEEFRKAPVENMDEVIYCVNGTYRLLEFLVAVCVVCYGVSETVFGEWSVMGSTIILVHSYYNVWLRAQLGWQSFLLRRDAVNKIKSLPMASDTQLEQYNDICAICYQDMNSAVITPCSHFFHAGCLKKWLYVQETCPLCHSQLKSQSPSTTVPNQDAPAANQSPVGQNEATANNKQGDNRKEEGTGEQEGDNGPIMSAGETSSGVLSAPQHLTKSSSSSSTAPSPLVTETKDESPSDEPSSSSSDTSYIPPAISSSHHLSSQSLARAEMSPTEPAPSPQLNPSLLLDSKESSTDLSSRPEQPTSPSEKQSPPCSL